MSLRLGGVVRVRWDGLGEKREDLGAFGEVGLRNGLEAREELLLLRLAKNCGHLRIAQAAVALERGHRRCVVAGGEGRAGAGHDLGPVSLEFIRK